MLLILARSPKTAEVEAVKAKLLQIYRTLSNDLTHLSQRLRLSAELGKLQFTTKSLVSLKVKLIQMIVP